MAYNRPLPSHLRQAPGNADTRSSSTEGTNSLSQSQSPALVARVQEKKIELENLQQLRDLSAGLAGQMQMLEDKLGTLADGTEGSRCFLLCVSTRRLGVTS